MVMMMMVIMLRDNYNGIKCGQGKSLHNINCLVIIVRKATFAPDCLRTLGVEFDP